MALSVKLYRVVGKGKDLATSANVLVHVRGKVESERHRLDTRLAALAPGALGEIHSLDQYRAVGLYGFRAASMIGAVLGGLALLLTLTGITASSPIY